MDSLHRLKYVSTPRAGLDEAQLRDILRAARTHNTRNGLTGFLAFSSDCFLQVIEGGRQSLTECLLRISRDDRHHNLVLLSFEAIDRREFSDWSMGYLAISARHQPLLMRYSYNGRLDPTTLHDGSLMMLLRDMATQTVDPRGQTTPPALATA